jgi:peptidoglycan/xylan/chitin deacetylase (PgdA/CDA1 family)
MTGVPKVLPFEFLSGLMPDKFIVCGHLVGSPDHFVRDHYRYPTLKEFTTFVEWIESMGYRFVNFEEYRKKDEGRKVLLTFDDGFHMLFGEVRQYLNSKKIPYMLFVLSDALKDPSFLIKTIPPRRTIAPGERIFLSEQELLVLKSEGVHIGFHSRSHNKVLPGHIKDPEMLSQLSIPPEFQHIFSEPLTFAYPYEAPSNYKSFNNYMKKELSYSYFFDTKGFIEDDGEHFFRPHIDAPKTIKAKNAIKQVLKQQLFARLIQLIKKSLLPAR